tara:strand:+ start:485 stop:883 length:399 start_codon:yes stop_codon:yes gene_type:complete
LHQRFTGKKRAKENPEQMKKQMDYAREFANEWHKSKEGIEWHKEHAKKFNFGKFDLEEKNCVVCDEKFKPKSHHAKFCSNKCKSQYRRLKGLDDVKENCKYCKKEFTKNKYSKRKFCSRDCDTESRRESKCL